MKTVINLKTDSELKKQAQKLADDLGLPLGTVINGYLREFIQNREVTFSNAPRMSPWLEKIIGEFETDYRKRKNLSPTFSTANEAKAYLDQL